MVTAATMIRDGKLWFRVLWQSGTILVLAAAVALLVNRARSDGLPISPSRPSVTPGTGEVAGTADISLDDARRLFLSGKVLFVDARSPGDYEEGHIPGARNLPPNAPAEQVMKVLSDTPDEAPIVVYCHGESCDLSGEVASMLLDMGFSNVRTLPDGWGRWIKHDLPRERGPGGPE